MMNEAANAGAGEPASPPPTYGLILAGGLARRMGGGDKTLIRVGEKTILERALARLGPQCAAPRGARRSTTSARLRALGRMAPSGGGAVAGCATA